MDTERERRRRPLDKAAVQFICDLHCDLLRPSLRDAEVHNASRMLILSLNEVSHQCRVTDIFFGAYPNAPPTPHLETRSSTLAIARSAKRADLAPMHGGVAGTRNDYGASSMTAARMAQTRFCMLPFSEYRAFARTPRLIPVRLTLNVSAVFLNKALRCRTGTRRSTE